MAILVDTDREILWAEFMRRISRDNEPINLGKTDLRAAFNAADDWVEANQAAYNTALPVAAQTNLTMKQKAELLMLVVGKRFEVT
jgi:hypothetical protein